MEKTQNFKLVDSTFEPGSAAAVLFNLVSSKITYHQREAFSNQERFNEDVAHSMKRISELKEVYRSLQDMIQQASEQGYHLKVSGTLKISAVKATRSKSTRVKKVVRTAELVEC